MRSSFTKISGARGEAATLQQMEAYFLELLDKLQGSSFISDLRGSLFHTSEQSLTSFLPGHWFQADKQQCYSKTCRNRILTPKNKSIKKTRHKFKGHLTKSKGHFPPSKIRRPDQMLPARFHFEPCDQDGPFAFSFLNNHPFYSDKHSSCDFQAKPVKAHNNMIQRGY